MGEETRCRHLMDYFRLAASIEPSAYHGLCFTNCRAMADFSRKRKNPNKTDTAMLTKRVLYFNEHF